MPLLRWLETKRLQECRQKPQPSLARIQALRTWGFRLLELRP
jgi:hypothetical protein